MRYMIEVATGKASGSAYHNQDRVLPRDGEGIVIKTHELDWKDYDRAVHVVRSPFDAIDSFWHWWADVIGRPRDNWDRFLRSQALEWRAHAEAWLGADIPTVLVRYEDLHVDAASVLSTVLGFLGEPGDVGRAVEAATLSNMRRLGDYGPAFFRRGTVGDSMAKYDPAQRAYVLKACGGVARRLGYE